LIHTFEWAERPDAAAATSRYGPRRAAADTRLAVLALQFDQADLAQDARAREVGSSEQSAPSSILREVRHSPLRAAQSHGTDRHTV